MDIFTHMFFTYLINFGIGSLKYNEYAMVFGVVLGILPDFDMLWMPVSWKYPIARHRGLSHSILFLVIVTAVLAAIIGPIINVSFFALFLIGLLSGLGHLCLDVLTTIGIPVFWPFSKREVSLGLERAINPYFIGISIFFIFFLFQLRAIKFDYSIYLLIITVLAAGIILYYLVKLIIKLYIHASHSTPEFKILALPTAGLFKWLLVGRNVKDDIMKLKYGKYNLLSGHLPKFRYFSCICSSDLRAPLNNSEKAKAYTYNLKEVQSFIKKFKYPLAEVVKNRKGASHYWTVFWFPLELIGLNRAMAIRVDLDIDGKYHTKHAFFKKITEM